MIRSNQFTEDNDFLIEPFLKVISNLPDKYIQEAKKNGSYYNFFIETKDYIIVPKLYNFVFKYIRYMKEYSPTYVEKLESNFKNYNIDLKNLDIDNINKHFDNMIYMDTLQILPKIIIDDDHFIYYENISETSSLSLIQFANKYSKCINFIKEHMHDGNIFIFPNHICDYYIIKDDKLILKYPIWNAFRWSYELPKFVTNLKNDIFKFKKFDSANDQKSIMLMLDNHTVIKDKLCL